jgi:tRNA(Ile)-lysidine synthase
MIKKINKTIEKHSMIKAGERLLLCVSGGPDSTAMLYAFDTISKEAGLRPFVAHVNHCLRGAESDSDQGYVEDTARSLHIPVICSREDTAACSRLDKISIETAARRLRYDFFIRTAKELGIDIIATAHTKDDQAETVLMRVIRGTGFRGLRGIPVKNNINGITIIRPLIYLTRKEILSYLASKGINPRTDRSNAKAKFFRNSVRLRLLPAIRKQYNPDIRNALSNLAALTQEDYEYLDSNHRKAFKKLAKIRKDNVVIFSLYDIKSRHLSIARGVIRHAIEYLRKGLDNIEYRHWQEIESLIYDRPRGSKVNLPNKVVAEKTERYLKFSIYKRPSPEGIKRPPVALKVPGAVSFGRYQLKTKIVKRIPDFSKKPKYSEYISIKDTDFPLILRAHNRGDRIRPLGMNGYKNVSDIFIDEKVPLNRRKDIPILVSSSGEVLCVFGLRLSDTCRIKADTENAVKLELLTR